MIPPRHFPSEVTGLGTAEKSSVIGEVDGDTKSDDKSAGVGVIIAEVEYYLGIDINATFSVPENIIKHRSRIKNTQTTKPKSNKFNQQIHV